VVEAWSGEPCEWHLGATSAWQKKRVRRRRCPRRGLPPNAGTYSCQPTYERGRRRGHVGIGRTARTCPSELPSLARWMALWMPVQLHWLLRRHCRRRPPPRQRLVLHPSARGRHRCRRCSSRVLGITPAERRAGRDATARRRIWAWPARPPQEAMGRPHLAHGLMDQVAGARIWCWLGHPAAVGSWCQRAAGGWPRL
jgi:hypothetical protein